ncbi:hypothetical protein [Spirosoma sp. KUDC1026]|uniref:hypothetical protein n=1 Tax=Spirosoma sp. KUDC1026 TaxID=2745947 RepID=UPI00159BDAD5|nr:hypothetical protein [Spirosoma sp. KUDC1026]QKZ14125.1 hypothetical protein HU175_16420 [Spirosoma sp. KUDC1026]
MSVTREHFFQFNPVDAANWNFRVVDPDVSRLDGLTALQRNDKAPDRFYASTNLDLGVETPDETTLSILAKINAFFSQRPGQSLLTDG